MALFDTAREIYLVAKDDATLAAAVTAERAALAAAFVNDSETAFELTNATVAGQTFGGTRSMTKRQRLAMLGMVVKMLSESAAFSSEGKASFQDHGNC